MPILAVIPPIVLLIYIYKKDNREKEPSTLLFMCFLFGVLISLPAIIMELILGGIFDSFLTEGTILYALADGFIVAAFSEELLKYLALKIKTWRSPHFNCSFDGIVYSVFVSLGFAALENILYVSDGGLSTAIMRTFTSIPGHASNAVFMGYFYSLAKKAQLENNKMLEKKYKRLALVVPILLHGLYDCLISVEEDFVGPVLSWIFILIWVYYIIFLYLITFKFVKKASKFDTYFHEITDSSTLAFVLKPESWICSCHNINIGNFCPRCGSKRQK